jgi:hypothetical protein
MRNSKKSTVLMFTVMAALLALAALPVAGQIMPANAQGQPMQGQSQGQAQAQGQGAQAQPVEAPQICGNQPLCYESADFAATITHFRTSVVNNYHLIDITMRFQNKTQQQLILGYVLSSGIATDDRGNRSIVGGANGYHGIGLVAGSNFDPKFVVRPAGFSDAQFELVLQGWPQVIGFTYALDLAVAEINSFEGNQHTLGEEYPVHFDGLTNGVSAASPMFSPGSVSGASGSVANAISNPCAAVGKNGKAANAISNASSAVAAVTSLWHRKKQDAGQAASGTLPGCDPNASAATVATSPIPATVTTKPSPIPAPAVQQAASRTPAGQATVPANGAARTPPATATAKPNVAQARPAAATPAKPSAAKPNVKAQVQQNTANTH